MSQRILHISDSHINNNQYTNNSKIPLGGLSLAVNLAIEIDIDSIVHSGNLFHYQCVDDNIIDAVRAELQKLSTVGIDFFCIMGDKELSGNGTAFSKLIEEKYIKQLDLTATKRENIAFFGFAHAETKEDIQIRLQSLSDTSQSTQNIVVTHQHLSPPCKQELADMSAEEFYSSTDLDIDIVLAGGTYEPSKWDAEDTNFSIVYSGATNPLTIAPEATITGSLIEVGSKDYKIQTANLRKIN